MKFVLPFLLLVLLLHPRGAAGELRPPGTNDVIALVGGSQLAEIAAAGYLEALMAVRSPGGPPRFRDLSWEGDTVFTRSRPVNFPDLKSLLTRSGATVVVLQFGRMESLAGTSSLPAFAKAFEEVLASVQSVVPQVVLLTPAPFTAGGALDDQTVEERNRNLRAYAAEIRLLGEVHQVPVVDVFSHLTLPSTKRAGSQAGDGLQLSRDDHLRLSAMILFELEGHSFLNIQDGSLEPVRRAVQAKHQLWMRYWRPTNWAFLAGDRTEQPSSRDHRDRSIRWFPAEMEKYVPLLQAADAEIALQARKVRDQEATR